MGGNKLILLWKDTLSPKPKELEQQETTHVVACQSYPFKYWPCRRLSPLFKDAPKCPFVVNIQLPDLLDAEIDWDLAFRPKWSFMRV